MSLRTVLPLAALTAMFCTYSPTWAQDKSEEQSAPPVPRNQMEVPRDRYIPVPPGEQPTERATQWTYNGHVSIQVNVNANGNNIIGDAANEPSIAVDPTNPRRMVIGWRQFDTISSDFRQAGWGYTTDGGYTWTFPGRIEAGIFRSDPVLAADPDGNFYYNSLTSDATGYWCKVFKSTNGGQTWAPGVYAYGGDKQWMTVDPTNGIGRGNLYAFWTEVYSICSGQFTRSYDHGQSFLPCTTIPGSPQWGTLDVGSDGTLYVCGDGFQFAKSTTMQNPSLPAQWQSSTTVNLGGSMVYAGGPNPGGLGGQVWLAVDRSTGPTAGNLYMLCTVDPVGSDPQDVMFVRSTNGGQTWSAPRRINDDPTNNGAWQWFGTMSVAPNGRIDVVWNDTRNHPGSYISELFYSHSEDGGLTWSPNEQMTLPWDPHIGWPQQNKIGDYYVMVSDERGADLAFAATFNGEEDVYYMRLGQPLCSDAGTIALDRPKYACESTATITVVDCGLNTDPNTIQTTTVTIASASEPSGENVLLTETAPATATFVGSIQLSATNAPGVLLVAPGDTVTTTYNDQDNGQGQPATVTATAIVDCTPPVISNVHVSDLQARSAKVTFDSNELARGTVHYGLSCSALNLSASSSGYTSSPVIDLNSLADNTTYYYSVTAEDQAGNSVTDNNGGACYWFTTLQVADYYTQLFTGDNDLDNVSVSFAPNASVDFYRGCDTAITALPTNPTGGTALSLTDDSNVQVNLTGGATVTLYGVSYNHFWVGSNGYITFSSGDSTYTPSLAAHFNQPRICALFDDLDPSQGGGSVSWKQLADHVAVTWLNVPVHNAGSPNTFQIEMYFDGRLAINYLAVADTNGLAGLSRGTGVPADFLMSDLSTLGPCQATPPTAQNANVNTNENTPATITLSATDDGLPNPPGALFYIITALPAHGSLADPGAGAIAAVPYTLVGGGRVVTYTPTLHYIGADSFTFKANDGGTPPDGGDSNVATIALTVIGVPQQVYAFPLDTNPGWTTQGQWAFGHPTGGGSHGKDPTNGHSGTNVYGYNLSGDYTNNMPKYTLTTTALDLHNVANVQLRFWRWLGVEKFDRATVEVSNDGTNWTTVWTNPVDVSLNDTAWTQQMYDIAAVADVHATVYVRWGMGLTDASTTYPGWNIDDIEIWGVVLQTWVLGDMNCDGVVNFGDINPFVLALTSQAQYEAAFPNCHWLSADVNGDGLVNFADINPFVALLTGAK